MEQHPHDPSRVISTREEHDENGIAYFDTRETDDDTGYHFTMRHKCEYTHSYEYAGTWYHSYTIVDSNRVNDWDE